MFTNNIIKRKLDINKISLYSDSKLIAWKNPKPYIKNAPYLQGWNNSVYQFDKTKLGNIPQIDKTVNSLITSYFQMFNSKFENKKNVVKSYLLKKRFKRASYKKIFISKQTIKHTSDKVVITLFTYNKQMVFLNEKIKLLKLISSGKSYKLVNSKHKTIKGLTYKFKFIKNLIRLYLNTVKANNLLTSSLYDYLKPMFKSDNPNHLKFLFAYINKIHIVNNKYVKKILLKLLKKEVLSNYYKVMLYINNSKFNETYLIRLQTLLEKIYNKKISFIIINLKSIFFNSDIMLNAISEKMKKRKNRILKTLTIIMEKAKLPNISSYSGVNNLSIGKYKNRKKALLNSFSIYKTAKFNYLNLLEYKYITGIKLHANGRLSKRLIAARSVRKARIVGGLKNKNSSLKALSTEMIRNQFNCNLDKAKLNCKTRNGAFGLKGWIGHS